MRGMMLLQSCFSIIIPVYNIGKYIEKCVNSIIRAIRKNDEIILVCGNSSDNSNELAIHYSKIYTNIKVIEQSGTGPSNARNDGLKIAKGEYVLFLDGDDFIDSEVLCKLLNEIRDNKYVSDVLITDFYNYKHAIKLTVLKQQLGYKEIYGLENIINNLSQRECFWNIWRYVYRRKFLVDNKIQFWENVYAEDLDFTVKVFLNKPSISFIPIAYYNYRLGREGSLMNKTPVVRVLSTLTVLAYDIDLLKKSNELWKQKVIDALQFEYILNLALICEMPKSEQGKALEIVRKDVLKNSGDKLVRIMYCMIKIFGIRFVASILSKIKRIKRKKEGRSL